MTSVIDAHVKYVLSIIFLKITDFILYTSHLSTDLLPIGYTSNCQNMILICNAGDRLHIIVSNLTICQEYLDKVVTFK